MKPRLELWLAIPTTVVITLLLLFSVMAEVWLEQKQYEESLREQAYILSEEMQAAWDFMSVNQDRINTDGDGTYTFKGLHCSIVGTSIGALFTHRTDYVIQAAQVDTTARRLPQTGASPWSWMRSATALSTGIPTRAAKDGPNATETPMPRRRLEIPWVWP